MRATGPCVGGFTTELIDTGVMATQFVRINRNDIVVEFDFGALAKTTFSCAWLASKNDRFGVFLRSCV